MQKKVIFHKKDFLNMNGHLSDASIYSSVSIDKYIKDDSKEFIATEFKIRDCDKAVYLDINLDTEEEKANTVYKLTVLINHISELRDVILKIKTDEQK